ncbi:hypothetical protein [Pseudonocardia sp. HH130630-07]|nr:hypothetical protein [Pseudonocardia sp. HH130630-07]
MTLKRIAAAIVVVAAAAGVGLVGNAPVQEAPTTTNQADLLNDLDILPI